MAFPEIVPGRARIPPGTTGGTAGTCCMHACNKCHVTMYRLFPASAQRSAHDNVTDQYPVQPQWLGVLSCPGQRAAPNTLLFDMRVSGCSTDADRRLFFRMESERAHAGVHHSAAGTFAWSSGTTGLRTELLYRTTWTSVVCTRTLTTLGAGDAYRRPVVTAWLDMHMQALPVTAAVALALWLWHRQTAARR